MDFRLILIPATTLPLGLVALLLAARAWQDQKRANSARHWPTTVGRIVVSDIRETAMRVRRQTSIRRYRLATRYAPHIVYEYTVGGTHYQGQRLQVGQQLLSSEASAAEREAGRYPVGGAVEVYYNPSDPAEATLDPRIGWGTQIVWLSALMMLILALVVVAIVLR